jgi:hypothetical protein
MCWDSLPAFSRVMPVSSLHAQSCFPLPQYFALWIHVPAHNSVSGWHIFRALHQIYVDFTPKIDRPALLAEPTLTVYVAAYFDFLLRLLLEFMTSFQLLPTSLLTPNLIFIIPTLCLSYSFHLLPLSLLFLLHYFIITWPLLTCGSLQAHRL